MDADRIVGIELDIFDPPCESDWLTNRPLLRGAPGQVLDDVAIAWVAPEVGDPIGVAQGDIHQPAPGPSALDGPGIGNDLQEILAPDTRRSDPEGRTGARAG